VSESDYMILYFKFKYEVILRGKDILISAFSTLVHFRESLHGFGQESLLCLAELLLDSAWKLGSCCESSLPNMPMFLSCC